MNKYLVAICASALVFSSANLKAEEVEQNEEIKNSIEEMNSDYSVDIVKQLNLSPEQAIDIGHINDVSLNRLRFAIEGFKAAKIEFENSKKSYFHEIEQILNDEQRKDFENLKLANPDILIKKGGFLINFKSLTIPEGDEEYAQYIKYIIDDETNPVLVSDNDSDGTSEKEAN